MITTRYVRDHLDEIRKAIADRGSAFPLEELLELDESWRKMKTELQEFQARRNKASLEISEMKKRGGDIQAQISAMGELKSKIDELEATIPSYESRIDALIWSVPNTLDPSVPLGMPPKANKHLGTWGKPRNKQTPSHEEILSKLGLLDVERAAKVSGARFYYLRGDIVMLEQALLKYALDKMSKKGFTLIEPPFMLKKRYYRGVAPLATFEDALYKITESGEASTNKAIEHMEEELFLIGTAEHPLAAMHAEEVFPGKALPLKYAGISPCFRREAGAHGKDTKGIFRVHQFDKVEQFIYCRQEDEEKYFKELEANSDEIFQELGLHHQKVLLCSGDTGHQMRRTIDFEAWFPSQNGFRELASCSSAGEWQSVRLDIKYEEKGSKKYMTTLNNTAISATRTTACIVENYYSEKDGSITVPDVLVPYVGKSKIG